MIEPIAGAGGVTSAGAPTGPATAANGAAFGDVYAGAAAPPEGGCQCDRNASAASAPSGASSTSGTSANAAAPLGAGLAVAAAPDGASIRPTSIDLASVELATIELTPALSGSSAEPVRAAPSTCGSCGLPFELAIDDDAVPTATTTAPTAPLEPFGVETTTHNWLIQALRDR